MKICVTGGLGFLGSHLVERLLTEGHDITIVDNLSSNVVAPTHFDLPTYYRSDYIHFYKHASQYDRVYHLASVVGPVGVLAHAGMIAHATINAAWEITRWCAAAGARLLYVSSSEVYGQHPGEVYDNTQARYDLQPSNARFEYALAKLTSEVIIQNTPQLDWRIVRPFNIAGPRQRSRGGFVLPRFVEQAMRREPFTIYGDGSQIRAFTHAHDMVDGIVRVMESDERAVYNLGNAANRITIKELARMTAEALGVPFSCRHVDPRDLWGPTFSEIGDKYPAHNLKARALGWAPYHWLEAIIQDTIAELSVKQ